LVFRAKLEKAKSQTQTDKGLVWMIFSKSNYKKNTKRNKL